MSNNILYCQLYVDSDQPKKKLLSQIATWLGTNVEAHGYYYEIQLANRSLDLVSNDDFDENLRKSGRDAFSHYRYYMEIDGPDQDEITYDQKYQQQVNFVTFLLEHFWAAGIPAIAACDFEDDLPYNGGYKADVAPWLKAQVVQAR